LGARADAADQKRAEQHGEARAHTGQTITETRKRGAECEHQRRTVSFRHEARWNLQSRHRADEHAAQRAECSEGQSKFRLPQRQHNVDEIRVAVVQRMSYARD